MSRFGMLGLCFAAICGAFVGCARPGRAEQIAPEGSVQSPSQSPRVAMTVPPTPHFYYKMEVPMDGFSDVLTLQNGAKRVGKLLEWGTLVYFWDAGGRGCVYRRPEVRNLQVRRAERLGEKPDLADLTVAFVERLPRDPGWHGKVRYDVKGKEGLPVLVADPNEQLHPKPGQQVKFVVHVLNAGRRSTRPFDYEIYMDDKLLASGRVDKPIAPMKQHLLELPWRWQDGQHHIRVQLDTHNANKEIAKWNNTFIDPIRAWTFFFAVSRSTYDGFADVRNCVDTFNFEDWAQYHVHMMNWLFENSVYPSAPKGILARVRIDNIIVVDNSRDPAQRAKWEPIRHRNHDPNDIIEYNGNWEFGPVKNRAHAARWAARVDWGLPHELGHQLGLVDIYQLNTSPFEVLVRNNDGTYCNSMHFFPWPQTMMHWHGPHLFSEQCAGYLNETRNNPRGYFGDYYYAIPDENYLQVLSNTGKPLKGVKIELYQRRAEGKLHGWIPGEPISTGSTGADGRWLMPNRPCPSHETFNGYKWKPNPWGKVNVVGGNAMILAKLVYGNHEEYHWLRLFDFNVAYFRGAKKRFTYTIKTRYPDAGAPEPPVGLKPVWHHPPGRWDLGLAWKPSPSGDVVEYRIYRKDSHGGWSVKPYTCYNIVAADKIRDGWYRSPAKYGEEFEFKGFYSRDNYFAVTAVDSAGRESDLSNVVYVPKAWDSDKLAVSPTGEVYFTLRGGGENQMLRWDSQHGLREFTLRPDLKHLDYRGPGFAGIAFDVKGRMVVTDAWNHQLAFYDAKTGDLLKLVGNPARRHESPSAAEGQFNEPVDLAVTDDGRIFVLERGNCRVSIFDADGKFLGSFGSKGVGELQFNRPAAISATGMKLAITDPGNRRVLIVDVSGEPRQIMVLNNVNASDRALIGPKGWIYVCGRGRDGEAILVFLPDGKLQREIYAVPGVRLYGPKGLYSDGTGKAYFVTGFPFRVLSIKLQG